MPKNKRILLVLFFILLILPGCVLIIAGVFKTYEMPQNIVSITNSYYFYQNEVSTIFYIKTETVGTFMADNPINVSVTTNRMDVRGVQLEFLGLSKYFPNHTRPILPTFPSVWSEKSIEEYEQAMDAYDKEFEKQFEGLGSNVVHLNNDTDIDFTLPYENITFPNYPTFSGMFTNLTYPVGGKFSIGTTVFTRDGGVIGYGMGNTAYIIEDYVEIAPLETKFQIQNNFIMTGLGWIGIGITLCLSGIALIVELNPFSNSENEIRLFAD